MAQSLTPLRQTVVQMLASQIENQSNLMLNLCTLSYDPQAFITVTDFDGGANYTTKTGIGAPSASDIRVFGSTSNAVTREQRIAFEETRLLDLNSLAAEIVNKVWVRAWNEINLDYFTLLFSGRTTAHPDNGVSGSPLAASGGGVVYFVDAYDYTDLGGGSFSQTNDHTLALSSANLSTILAKRRTYKDRAGKAQRTQQAPYLVVVPELETLARDLVGQKGRLYDGSGLQSGFEGRIKDVIVVPGGTTAQTDAWALVWVDESTGRKIGPVCSHIREMPKVKIGYHPDDSDIHIYSKFTYDNFYHTDEGNLMFSDPS